MRSIALAICLLLGMAGTAMGQAIANMSRTGDLALTYHEVHSSAPPSRYYIYVVGPEGFEPPTKGL